VETVSGEDFGPGKKMTDTRGPHVGEGEEESGVPIRVASWAAGWLLELGRNGSPEPFSIFFLFFLLFYFCFPI
jgi:hypothetical protein